VAFETPIKGLSSSRPGLLSCFLACPGPKGALYDIVSRLFAHLLRIGTNRFFYEAFFVIDLSLTNRSIRRTKFSSNRVEKILSMDPSISFR
jgi:hypothetical protein